MLKLSNPELKNIPWQERPGNCSVPIWRYSENPIIPRNAGTMRKQHFQQRGSSLPGRFRGGVPRRQPAAADGPARRIQL